MLTPHSSEADVASVPTTQGEQPGIVKALGAVTGGALGLGLGQLIASLLVPGVGMVTAIGWAGGALVGSLTGGKIAGRLEEAVFEGIPEEELFIYEDALRRGRTILVAIAEDDKGADAVREAFNRAGAESIDRAREMWWVGLRDVEKEAYESTGGTFDANERHFRAGFEAALDRRNRGKPYEQCRAALRERYPDLEGNSAFRKGFERGRRHLESIAEPREEGKSRAAG
jgi:hypothetical protein